MSMLVELVSRWLCIECCPVWMERTRDDAGSDEAGLDGSRSGVEFFCLLGRETGLQ